MHNKLDKIITAYYRVESLQEYLEDVELDASTRDALTKLLDNLEIDARTMQMDIDRAYDSEVG